LAGSCGDRGAKGASWGAGVPIEVAGGAGGRVGAGGS
jgi:hypothetical protein